MLKLNDFASKISCYTSVEVYEYGSDEKERLLYSGAWCDMLNLFGSNAQYLEVLQMFVYTDSVRIYVTII